MIGKHELSQKLLAHSSEEDRCFKLLSTACSLPFFLGAVSCADAPCGALPFAVGALPFRARSRRADGVSDASLYFPT